MPHRQCLTTLDSRALFFLGLVLVAALLRAGVLGYLHWIGTHDPAAINALATLRLQLHELQHAQKSALTPQAEAAVESALASPWLQQALARPGREALRHVYASVRDDIRSRLLPALVSGDRAAAAPIAGPLQRRLGEIASGLERDSERLNVVEAYAQVITLLLVAAALALSLHDVRKTVMSPLQELLGATRKLRDGDLDIRVAYQASHEIGQLAASFNAMADALADSHRNLEAIVAQKVQSLARANAALELLFRSSRRIADRPAHAGELEELVQRFQTLLPGLQLRLCLQASAVRGMHAVTAQRDPGSGLCPPQDCEGETCGYDDVQRYTIRSQGETLGELRVRLTDARVPAEWEAEMIQALTDLIGSALMLGRQRERDDHLLILKERTTIARELHDSLAQSLSYMKIQVSRIEKLLRRGEERAELEAATAELREGLSEAYRQLRELLTTFRLGVGEGDLAQAMQAAVRDFAQRGDVDIRLELAPLATPLTATEQIHVLQVMREAVTNSLRHAGASRIHVALRQQGDDVELCVEDDGRGIAPCDDRQQHYGIIIMRERAHAIHGSLAISPHEPHGTRVRLAFRPSFLAGPARES